jgi:hypothetical protein
MYRALGVGTAPFAFGRRAVALMDSDPSVADRIDAVADRMVFTDFLIDEVSRFIDSLPKPSVDASRLYENVDSLEVFLLCTCVDTLAAGGAWEEFPAWLCSNREGVECALQRPSQGAAAVDRYITTTDTLHSNYRLASGSSKGFADFFLSLPLLAKRFIGESILMVKGPFWDTNFSSRLRAWQKRPLDDKLNRLAREYFYEIRSQYAHASRVHPVSSPSLLRRHDEAEARAEAISNRGWNLLLVYETDHSDSVRMTLLVKSSARESDLLTLALTSYVLHTKLGLRLPDIFPELVLSSIRAKHAIRSAILELERNRDCYHLLHRRLFPYSGRDHNRSPLPLLSTSAAQHLLTHHADSVDLFSTDLQGYIREVGFLNKALAALDRATGDEGAGNSPRQPSAVLDDPQVSHSYLILQHYHDSLPLNLRYHLESGQVNYRHDAITDA